MKRTILVALVLLLGLFVSTSFAVEVTLLGPKQYSRTTGKPNVYTSTFSGTVCWGRLIITNGDQKGNFRVSSAVVKINDEQIFGPNDFNQKVSELEAQINLLANNTISIELRSAPKSYVTVKVIQKFEDAETSVMEGAVPPLDIPIEVTTIQYKTENGALIDIEAVKGRVLIWFDPNVSETIAENFMLSNGGKLISKIPSIRYYVVNVTPGNETNFINIMRGNPNVLLTAPDILLKTQQVAQFPNDWDIYPPKVKDILSWHLIEINAPLAWESINPSQLTDIEIGIIEQSYLGLAQGLQDYASRLQSIPSFPQISNHEDAVHGTVVTALAAAQGNNGFGNIGVNWWSRVRLIAPGWVPGWIPERVASSIYIYGIPLIVDKGSQVINLSAAAGDDNGICGKLVDPTEKSIFQNGLYETIQGLNLIYPNFLVVKAAGNDNCDHNNYTWVSKPDNLMIVGASGANHGKVDSSDYGDYIDLAAPGQGILWIDYTLPIGSEPSALIEGTSWSAPLVTGAAALVWSKEPNLSPKQVIQRLKDTAQPFSGTVPSGKFGAGILDVYRALFPTIPLVLTSINVTPAAAALTVGNTQQFTATAFDQFNVPMVPQPTFTWASSNTTIGTINAAGLFSALSAGGPINFTASVGSVSGSASVAVSALPPSPPPGGPWRMFGHDPQHTGRSEFTGPQQLNLNWQKQVTAQFSPVSSPIVGPDNTIYIGVNTFDSTSPNNFYGYLKALDPSGSPTKWKELKIGNQIVSTPALAEDGTIYISSINYDTTSSTNYFTYLNAIDSNGNPIWTYKLGETLNVGSFKSSPVINYDNTILICDDQVYLHAINPDGTLRWRGSLYSNSESSPAVDSTGVIYVVNAGTAIVAFYPDGRIKFRRSFEAFGCSDEDSSPSIGPNGEIYFGIHSGCGGGSNDFNDLVALDAGGNLLWRKKVDGKIYAPPAISNNGTIYVTTLSLSSFKNYLHSFNPDGSLNWSIEIGSYGTLNPPTIDASGTIYVISGGIIQALNQDGTLKWKFNGDIGPDSQPAIDQNGMLYTIGVNMFSAFKP